MKILLISEKEIKQESLIEINTDPKVLSKIINTVQETQLQPVLGTALYTALMDGVYQLATNATPLTDAMLDMLENYCIPFITFASMADFIILNNYKLSEKGTLKLTDNQGTAITSQEIEYAKNYYDNFTATYKRNLIKYLLDNKLTTQVSTDKNFTGESIGWFLQRDRYFGSRNIYYNEQNTYPIGNQYGYAREGSCPPWENFYSGGWFLP